MSKKNGYGPMFANIVDERPGMTWKPEAPPLIASKGIKEIELDCETTGLAWWDGDRVIGTAVGYEDPSAPEGYRTQYLPEAHQGGGNLDPETCKRWRERELRDVRITNLNTRFDIHHLREVGTDLEAQNCTFSDVQHSAALLDDHRLQSNLDVLMWDYLKKRKTGKELDAKRMAEYHAGEVAPRAEGDVRGVYELRKAMRPLLEAEDLLRVHHLEDELIPVVCEMEKNGAPIDVPLLETFIKESEQEFLRYLWSIHRETGLNINPDSSKDLEKLFKHLKLPMTTLKSGAPSFTDAVLKRTGHPVIEMVRSAAKLSGLRSDYLLKYKNNIDRKGILRYALHQLKVSKDEQGHPGEAGTVSGRFSSTKITRTFGVNIQQVMKVAKQVSKYGDKYIVRQLIVPRSGLWLSADAEQIEYRFFASLVNNPEVIEGYRKNPRMSFHKFVHELVKAHKPDITYRQQKDLNFAKIYGAGLKKMALMMEFITQQEFEELVREKASKYHPKLAKAREVDEIYAKLIPEAAALIRLASSTAEKRGYVKTLLGRRARFPNGWRVHKALNAIIQGGAADVNKQKLVELHKARKDTGFLMRFTVHDEVDGDIPDVEAAAKVQEILDTQSFPELKVPILWGVNTGANWKECAGE